MPPLGRPAVPLCLKLSSFSGWGTFSVKTRTVPGKLGQVGHSNQDQGQILFLEPHSEAGVFTKGKNREETLPI